MGIAEIDCQIRVWGCHVAPAELGLRENVKPLRDRNEPHFGQALRGFGAKGKCLSVAPFRSLLERDARTLFDADADVIAYAVAPHTLNFELPEDMKLIERRTARWGNDLPNGIYTPDLVVHYGRTSKETSSIIAVEVRAHDLCRRPSWSKWEPYIREAYAIGFNLDFIVLDERIIRREPRLRNSRVLNRHRWRMGSRDFVAAERTIMAIIDLRGDATIEDLIAASRVPKDGNGDRAFRAIMNHILDGELVFDRDRLLDRGTPVWRRVAS